MPELQASVVVEQSEQALRDLISEPIKNIGKQLGERPAQLTLAGNLTANLIADPAEDLADNAAEILDIAGIALGTVTGNPLLVAASLKALVHHEVLSTIEDGITGALDRLFAPEPPPGAVERRRAPPGRRAPLAPGAASADPMISHGAHPGHRRAQRDRSRGHRSVGHRSVVPERRAFRSDRRHLRATFVAVRRGPLRSAGYA